MTKTKSKCTVLLKVQRRYPSYRLRSDLDRAGWRSMVSLFLTACGVHPPKHLSHFFEWLPQDRHVTLFNLMETLGEFEQAGNAEAAQSLRDQIGVSGMVGQVSEVSEVCNRFLKIT